MGSSSLKNLGSFQKLCGRDALNKVYLTTTMWDEVELSVGEGRLEELKTKYWKTMIAQGAQVARCRKDDDSPKNLVRTIVTFLVINRSAHINSMSYRSTPQTERPHFSHRLSNPDQGLLRICKKTHRDATSPREEHRHDYKHHLHIRTLRTGEHRHPLKLDTNDPQTCKKNH